MPRRTSSFAVLLTLGLLWAVGASAAVEQSDPRLDAAIAVYRQDGADKALPEFERLARLFRHSTQRHDEAAALRYTGECHWRLGNFREARSYLDRALTLDRASGDRLALGKTLNVLGLLEWDLGHYDQAIGVFKRAGTLGRELGDKRLEGASLNNLSLVYDELGDYQTSLQQYHQVLDLYRGADIPRGLVGDTLGNLGGTHLLLGRYREALDYYRQALKISEALQSTASMSQDHGNIALCLLGLGQVDEALGHFDLAIDLAAQAGMQQDRAYWLLGKGNGLVQKGRYGKGLEYQREALAVYEKLGAQAELGEALYDMGRLYLLLGDADSAEEYFSRALNSARSIGLSRAVTLNLIALGDLQFRGAQFEAATALYDQARQRSAQSDERQHLAQSLLRLALAHRQLQQLKPASDEVAQALTLSRQIGARLVEAEALFAQAELDRLRQRFTAALAGFIAAEAAQAQIGDPDLLWQIDFSRARTYEALGNKTAAIEALIAAVTVIESVRSRLLEERFRAGYVQDKYEVYTELVRLQLELGRTAEAFSTAERLRARSYAEQLQGRIAAPLSPEDQQTEAQLRARIRQLQRALGEEESQGRSASRPRAVNTYSHELLLAEQEYQGFVVSRSNALPLDAAIDNPPSAAEIQTRLAQGEGLLEYVVGQDSMTVFVLTTHSVSARTFAVRRADLGSRIGLLRDLIRHPGDDRWGKPAAALSATLWTPIEAAGWLKDIDHLYIVPHGVLNYLPFALLPRPGTGPQQLVVDTYTVAYLPAATALLQDAHASNAPRGLLAMAPARSRLRYAPDEARAVDALFRPDSRLLVGTGATEEQFKALAGQYRVLHLATHGNFNKRYPLLSGLELEADANEDGMLQVHEILALKLTADLVTLSACDTALGSGYFAETPAGDDFVGMTRAFLAAGSASVMATLWEVDDRSSVALMTRFYGYLNQSETPNEPDALARAQQDLRSSNNFRHPYFWAPFILVGKTRRVQSHNALTARR
jgi:CHAT domain-containing protein